MSHPPRSVPLGFGTTGPGLTQPALACFSGRWVRSEAPIDCGRWLEIEALVWSGVHMAAGPGVSTAGIVVVGGVAKGTGRQLDGHAHDEFPA